VDVEVDRWLSETNPGLEAALRRVTEIILGADPPLTAYVKYGTVTFAYQGDLAAFIQPKSHRVSLMFNRGARIPGDFQHLEGSGPTARFMRFADLAEVEERAGELAAVARAWCQLQGSRR
jgi:hypothetical protein